MFSQSWNWRQSNELESKMIDTGKDASWRELIGPQLRLTQERLWLKD
uniref:Uncharacterized protein n=1 Tax=Brassica oleracea TaxID=3712 RepID=A0A3P6F0V8_BRAOL|nr:unnamed protein product [Brassica oleracea]